MNANDLLPFQATLLNAACANTVPPIKMFEAMMKDGGFSFAWMITGCEGGFQKQKYGVLTMPGTDGKFNLENLKAEIRRLNSVITPWGFHLSLGNHSDAYYFNDDPLITEKCPQWITVEGVNHVWIKNPGKDLTNSDEVEWDSTCKVFVVLKQG